MSRKIMHVLALSIFCIICFSTIGVYATWTFASGTPVDYSYGIKVDMKGFNWEGSDVLPDDNDGYNHHWLIENLVGGVTPDGKEIGLNNPNSDLSDYVADRLKGGLGWSRDYFGSMAVTGGNEVEEIFGTKAANLSFIIYVESNTEYYIYTTSVYLGERGAPNWLGTSNSTPGQPSVPIGEYIYPVYKTRITRPNTSSDWTIEQTLLGKAKSDWYDENRRNANITQIPSFDATSWVETRMGTQMNATNAIWTFKGDKPIVYANSITEKIYYRITPKSAGNVKVTSTNAKANIVVYTSSGAGLASSTIYTESGNRVSGLTFSASANTMYYIEVSGDTTIPLEIA